MMEIRFPGKAERTRRTACGKHQSVLHVGEVESCLQVAHQSALGGQLALPDATLPFAKVILRQLAQQDWDKIAVATYMAP